MERSDAFEDLQVVRRILEMTHRRVDPQMFHMIIWGVVVLVWYPLMNVFELNGWGDRRWILIAAALGGGTVASGIGGFLANRTPRLRASNTRLAAQCGALVAVFVGAGVVLSVAIPVILEGGEQFIPHVWGFLYSLMVLALGVVYSREFLWSGLVIFAASVAALAVLRYSGFILGAAMGLGLIVPGVIAERRVARMKRETVDAEA